MGEDMQARVESGKSPAEARDMRKVHRELSGSDAVAAGRWVGSGKVQVTTQFDFAGGDGERAAPECWRDSGRGKGVKVFDDRLHWRFVGAAFVGSTSRLFAVLSVVRD
jgi:hypothetical protein